MRHDLIMELRGAHTPFALATTGGGAQFIADYLATPGGSATFLEGVVPYAQRATCEYLGFEPESYTSDETARRLASVAMTRAERLDERAFVLGLGATASLASDRPKRGAHRAFCAVQSRWGIYTAALELEKNARSRAQEERLVADFILATALFVIRSRELVQPTWREETTSLELETDENFPLSENDCATITWTRIESRDTAFLYGRRDAIPEDASTVAIRWRDGRPEEYCSLEPFRERAAIGVLPGSFNPAHLGHVGMATYGASRLSARVDFELSARNVDKPSLDPTSIVRRARALAQIAPDATLWLTNAPRFVDKGTLLPNRVFLVGADTILRLANPKYAGGSVEARDAVLAQLERSNARFLVFPRTIHGELVATKQMQESLPRALARRCEFVEPEEFLENISSSEIRREQRGR